MNPAPPNFTAALRDLKTDYLSKRLELLTQREEFLASLDWQKTAVQLSQETGIPAHILCYERRKRNLPKPRWQHSEESIAARSGHVRRRVSPEQWAAVNWLNQQDIVIARQLGVSRERVRQIRRKFGHPNPINYHQPTGPTYKQAALALAALHPDWTRRELVKALGCSIGTVAGLRLGQDSRKKYPWHLMNWALSNRDLGHIWGLSAHSIAMHRYQHRLGPAILSARLPTYGQAIKNEQRKVSKVTTKSVTSDQVTSDKPLDKHESAV